MIDLHKSDIEGVYTASEYLASWHGYVPVKVIKFDEAVENVEVAKAFKVVR